MQESQGLKRTHGRTHSLTEPTPHERVDYKAEYLKIKRKELSTSLISREEEEVFGNMNTEDSAKDEFKRNHKDVWNFIVNSSSNKKFNEASEM
jgi:hypothetical protein